MDLELAKQLSAKSSTKIVFCVVSGLGGLDRHETQRSELERAEIPHLDRLAARSEVGLTQPIAPGVTPAGVSGVVALLGYDPFRYRGAAGGAPELPSLAETWGISAAVIANGGGPLERVAIAAGATPLAGGAPASAEGAIEGSLGDGIAAVRAHWQEFDLFFVGFTKPGLAGASGDFELKCRTLHELDTHVPELLGLGADVLVIGGDCSLPALYGRESWHPVPFLIHSELCREGNAQHFNEQECLRGSLGVFPAVEAMPLVMAHAQRFQPFGG